MLLLKPADITPSMVTASNAGAVDADYDPATSYGLNARVFLHETGKAYTCIQAPAIDKYPSTNPLYWMLSGPSNRWAMWDTEISTASQTTGSLTTTVVVPTRCNAMSLHGLSGQTLTVVQRSPDGVLLKTHTQSLATKATTWYSYFFGQREQVREVLITGLPPIGGCSYEITVGTDAGGPAACAAVNIGNATDIGSAEFGFATSIIDYSRKETSSTGVQSLKQGRYSKRMSGTLRMTRAQYNTVSELLESVRSIPCTWVGVPGKADYAPMTFLGFFRDFQIEVTGPTHHICSLEIEGLT